MAEASDGGIDPQAGVAIGGAGEIGLLDERFDERDQLVDELRFTGWRLGLARPGRIGLHTGLLLPQPAVLGSGCRGGLGPGRTLRLRAPAGGTRRGRSAGGTLRLLRGRAGGRLVRLVRQMLLHLLLEA